MEHVLELEAQLRETKEKLAEAQAFIAELQRQPFGPKAEKLSSEQKKQLEQLASDLQEEARKPPPAIQQVLAEERRARRRPRPRHAQPQWLDMHTNGGTPPTRCWTTLSSSATTACPTGTRCSRSSTTACTSSPASPA